jgi:hypothetical protein
MPSGDQWIRAWRELPDKERLSGLSLCSEQPLKMKTLAT